MQEKIEAIIQALRDLKWQYTNKAALRKIERIIIDLEELSELGKYNE